MVEAMDHGPTIVPTTNHLGQHYSPPWLIANEIRNTRNEYKIKHGSKLKNENREKNNANLISFGLSIESKMMACTRMIWLSGTTKSNE